MLDESKLLELIAQVRKNEEAAVLAVAPTHPGGLTFHRARALILNPSRWTADERQHVASCRRCASLLASCERNLTHPALSVLVGWLLGELVGGDVRVMKYHLEEGECQRCRRLLDSPWLRAWAALVRSGQRTLAEVRGLVDAAVTAFAPLPAREGAFDPAPRPPFQLRATRPDGSLTVTLRETDEGRCVVHAQTSDAADAGKRVRVEVLGAGEPLEADVSLQPWDGRGCDGQEDLGHFSGVAERLGADCLILAALRNGPPDESPKPPTAYDAAFFGRSVRLHLRRAGEMGLSAVVTGVWV
jgi:hypothetical protein